SSVSPLRTYAPGSKRTAATRPGIDARTSTDITGCNSMYDAMRDARAMSPSMRSSARAVPNAGVVQSSAAPTPQAPRPSASRSNVPRVMLSIEGDGPLSSTDPRSLSAIPFVYMADSRETPQSQSTRALQRGKSLASGGPSLDHGSVDAACTLSGANAAADGVA